MKKLILLSLLTLATIFVFAQRSGGDPEARIQKRVNQLTEKLDLSETQQAQVSTLLTSQQASRVNQGKKRSDLTEAEKETIKVNRKAAKAEFDGQMAAILTPEQNELYKNLPKGKRKKGGQKGKGKKTGGRKSSGERSEARLTKLTEQLDLSAQQQSAIKELMVSRKQSHEAFRKSKKDNAELDREAMKSERKAANAAYHAELEKILTPNQLETYEKLKAERKAKGKKKERNGRK